MPNWIVAGLFIFTHPLGSHGWLSTLGKIFFLRRFHFKCARNTAFYLVIFFSPPFSVAPASCESSWDRDHIWARAAALHHSFSNSGSLIHCAWSEIEPSCLCRDQAGWLTHCTTAGTASNLFLSRWLKTILRVACLKNEISGPQNGDL